MKHLLGIYIEGKLWGKIHLRDFPGFLKGEPITIGRRETCDICIPKSTVSREHAVIQYVDGKVRLIDRGSLNKFNVKGKIETDIELKNGMQVVIGRGAKDPEAVVLMYVELEEAESTEGAYASMKKGSSVKSGNSMRRRFIAFMADTAVFVFMCVGFCGIMALLFGFGKVMKIIMLLGVLMIGWLYFALAESGENRGSVGKAILGLQVVDYEGNTISFKRATIRLFARIPSAFTLFLPIFGRKRTLHDVIAKTLVIQK